MRQVAIAEARSSEKSAPDRKPGFQAGSSAKPTQDALAVEWAKQDSNLRPPACKAGALDQTELFARGAKVQG